MLTMYPPTRTSSMKLGEVPAVGVGGVEVAVGAVVVAAVVVVGDVVVVEADVVDVADN